MCTFNFYFFPICYFDSDLFILYTFFLIHLPSVAHQNFFNWISSSFTPHWFMGLESILYASLAKFIWFKSSSRLESVYECLGWSHILFALLQFQESILLHQNISVLDLWFDSHELEQACKSVGVDDDDDAATTTFGNANSYNWLQYI